MRRMLIGISAALFALVSAADTVPSPGGPFAGSTIDPNLYLTGKTLDFSVARSLPYKRPYWVAFENVIATTPTGSERLLLLMGVGKKGRDLEPVALVPHTTVKVPQAAITIDGFDDDWALIAPAVSDPAGDDYGATAPEAGTDLASVSLARDETHVYGRVALHDGGPRDRTMYIVEFQQYLLQMHSPGDILVNCSKPTPNGWECGVGDRTGAQRAHYLPSANVVKAGAGFIEWKIPIGDLENRPYHPWAMYPADGKRDRGIENRFIRSYIHPSDADVTDELPTFGRPLVIDFFE